MGFTSQTELQKALYAFFAFHDWNRSEQLFCRRENLSDWRWFCPLFIVYVAHSCVFISQVRLLVKFMKYNMFCKKTNERSKALWVHCGNIYCGCSGDALLQFKHFPCLWSKSLCHVCGLQGVFSDEFRDLQTVNGWNSSELIWSTQISLMYN